MTEASVELGGQPQTVTVAKDWKTRALDWIFAQGAVVVLLIAFLVWTIYDGTQREKLRIEAAQKRMEWEEKFWGKVDGRLTEISTKMNDMAESYVKSLDRIILANERKTERDEIRFDKIVYRIKGMQ